MGSLIINRLETWQGLTISPWDLSDDRKGGQRAELCTNCYTVLMSLVGASRGGIMQGLLRTWGVKIGWELLGEFARAIVLFVLD
jgi:hypothetical protein